jgi:hypothetical protein
MGGVTAAAAAFVLPTDQGAMTPFVLNDRPLFARGAHHGAVRWEIVTAEYFAALRIRRLDGRLFSADDRRGAPAVAVVNRAMSRRYWGDRSAVRARVTMGAADQRAVDEMREIVGVVDDVRGRDGSPAEPTVYIPLSQASDRVLAAQQTRTPLRWIVRVASDAALLGSGVASAIERSAQGAPVVVVPSMSELLAEQAARARFTLQLLGAFAVLAVLLALVGVYGFVANAVAQRKKELCIRSALGASRADLLRLVSRQGTQIVLGGALVGIAAAAMMGAVSEHVVVGARALDSATLVIVALSQAVAAAIATFMAARPAMHIDPRRVVD